MFFIYDKKRTNFVIMKLTQEQINQATIKIEAHLKDIGIINNYSLLNIEELLEDENSRLFIYQISNPSFKTNISIEYDFGKDALQSDDSTSFSWMDYKKITE